MIRSRSAFAFSGHFEPLKFGSKYVVRTLLSRGAHIDRRSASGNQPQVLLSSISECTINAMQFVSLKCLAARVISEKKIPYTGQIPVSLENFIRIH